MQYQRDKALVRTVGGLALLLGAILMIVTIVITFVSLATGGGRGDLVHGAFAFALALVMSSTLMGCGAQFQRLTFYTAADVDNMRMAWTGLLIVLVLTGIPAYWVIPPLYQLALFCVVILIFIRGAVIRLSRP